jgi:uncharacterized membrane protein YphA (DoxX/SURF4 family)
MTSVSEVTGSRRDRALDIVGLAARLILAVVLLVSGFIKAGNPAETKVAVEAYQLLPDSIAAVVAAILPYLEIATGVLLLLGLATRLGGILAGLLMVAFLIGVGSAAARGLNIDCGCFGGGGQVAAGHTNYTWELLRDVGLLVLAIYLVIRPTSILSVDRWASSRSAASA